MTRINLSPSIAQRLLSEGPLSAWANHRKLGNLAGPPSDSQLEGRLVHAAVLEDTSDLVIVEADSFRTKDAKAIRDAALADGKTPVVAPKWEGFKKRAFGIRESLANRNVFLDGRTEVRFNWVEDVEGGRIVNCSGVLDEWNEGDMVTDLKGCGSTFPTTHFCKGQISRSHALLQDAAYKSAVAERLGCDRDEVTVRFAFVQTEEPFASKIIELSKEFQEISYIRWRRAIDQWHELLELGVEKEHWDRDMDVETIYPDGWLLTQELELEAMES